MRCVVIHDASCLIDLRKGGLLPVLRRLPHRLAVPLPVREAEVLTFTSREWAMLDKGGMETIDLPPAGVQAASALKRRHGGLSFHDCFCLVTAQYIQNAILLTGDDLLRKVAAKADIRVHGVLWIIDELKAANACDNALLIKALKIWQADPSVFLPDNLIEQSLHCLKQGGG